MWRWRQDGGYSCSGLGSEGGEMKKASPEARLFSVAVCALWKQQRLPEGLRYRLAGSSGRQQRVDLREDGRNLVRHTGHHGASRYGHETSHQSIFDEVLASGVSPNPELPNDIN